MGIHLTGVMFYGIMIDDNVADSLGDWTNLDDENCKVSWHGFADDESSHRIFIFKKDSKFEVEPGEIQTIDLSKLQEKQKFNEQIKEFCQKINVPYVKPAWYLVSKYS